MPKANKNLNANENLLDHNGHPDDNSACPDATGDNSLSEKQVQISHPKIRGYNQEMVIAQLVATMPYSQKLIPEID